MTHTNEPLLKACVLGVLVHFGFGRVASLEFSRLFKAGEDRETAASRERRSSDGPFVVTRREVEMPLSPAFKRWAKFKGRYASKTKMNQYRIKLSASLA